MKESLNTTETGPSSSSSPLTSSSLNNSEVPNFPPLLSCPSYNRFNMSSQRFVVLVPPPLQGHITPLLQLGSILESRGFSIVVAHSDFNAPDPNNNPTFSFFTLSDDEVTGLDKSLHNLSRVMVAVNRNYRAPFHDFIANHMIQNHVEVEAGKVEHRRVHCVIIYDRIMHFVDQVANDLQIPTIAMRTNCCAYEFSRKLVLRLTEERCLPLPESQMEDMVPELPPFRYKDLPFPQIPTTPAVTPSTNAEGTPDAAKEIWKIVHRNGSSKAVIWNTMEELEGRKTLSLLEQYYHAPFFCVAPIHKMAPPSLKTSLIREDNDCVEWLDKQSPNSVLYVSLGSIVAMDQNELIEAAWGLVNSGVPFLWVIRKISSTPLDTKKGTANLSDGFEDIFGERGKIVEWAPQKEVLSHPAVGGFLSHCGWNSLMESFSEGVPIICKPSYYDQLINARYVSEVWKVGIQLERSLDRGGVQKTVRRLMVNEAEGNEIRKRALQFKRKFEVSMQKGGSSYQSFEKLTDLISSFYM